ncbi:MAG: ferric reductase-like protein, partial [Psychrobacter urativorans]
MNINNPTNSQTVFKTNLLIQTLWIGLILSIAIGAGSYALLTWGDTAAQILTTTDKHFWYLSRASGVIAYTLFWLAVVFGLLLSTRLGKHFNAARVFALHQYLSLI